MAKGTSKKSDAPAESKAFVSEDAQENYMISLATKLAEKQLREGTASSQVITHYLKLGSSKEKLEKEVLRKQSVLMEAKTKNIEKSDEMDQMYINAIEAMKRYSGGGTS